MAIRCRLTTLPFDVTAGKGGGVVDAKTRPILAATNRETGQFVRLIGRQRRIAEQLAELAKTGIPILIPDG